MSFSIKMKFGGDTVVLKRQGEDRCNSLVAQFVTHEEILPKLDKCINEVFSKKMAFLRCPAQF